MRDSDQALHKAIQEELADTLQGNIPTQRQQRLLQRAQDGYYNDLHGTPALPQTELYHELIHAGLGGMCYRVTRGDFSSTADEVAEWMLSGGGKEASRRHGNFLRDYA